MTAHFDKALGLALLKLKRKDLFEDEIRSLLHAEDSETTDQVVKWLNEHGCLNERRTAETAFKKHEGKRAVAYSKLEEELLRRGASPGLVSSLRPEVSESDAAYALLCARYKPVWKERGKGARFLCARGYESEVVEQAIDRFFGDSGLVADDA